MDRRTFLSFVLISPVAAALKPESVVKAGFKYHMYPAQAAFMNSDVPVALYGIPYYSNSDILLGQWLGINRSLTTE